MEALEGEGSRPAAPAGRLDRPGTQLAIAAVVIVGGTALLARVSPWTEALGATTGALCVWLAARSNFWTWPLGIANNLLYLIVFWSSRLYANALLQLFYAAIAIYGLWRWRVGRGTAPVRPVERVGAVELSWVAGLAVAAAIGLTYVLAPHSEVPALDASTTAASLGAQWLMSRRRIENWWIWAAVDVVYVPFYASQGLWVTAGLYTLFLALCVVALRHWGAELRAQRAS